MDIKLNQAYSFHQQGLRDYQEDFRFPETDTPDSKQRFFIVCDGVGGCDKGEVASQTVCGAFGKALRNVNFNKDFTNKDFQQALNYAYDALDKNATEASKDMGTTLAFVCFHGGGCTMAHIGDSRIYQVRPTEGILYRSDDHSMVNSLVHSGSLTPEQGVNHPQGNVITRYMEPVEKDQNRCMATVMRTTDVKAGDYFFLCSDGVLHCVSDDELCSILTGKETDKEKMKIIAEKSRDSEDNNTAYLISVAEVVMDPIMKEEVSIPNENFHTTKRIKRVSQSLEEIESVQSLNLWNRIKRIFN